jgi:hypothetical protein
VDRSKLPTNVTDHRAQLGLHKLNGKNNAIYIVPLLDPELERSYVRFMSGINVEIGDGTVARLTGQVVVTSRRLLGLATDGTLGTADLSLDPNRIFVFSFDFESAQEVTTRDNWRGKPVVAIFKSKAGVEPAFQVQVFSVQVVVMNDGSISFSSLQQFLTYASATGRAGLS